MSFSGLFDVQRRESGLADWRPLDYGGLLFMVASGALHLRTRVRQFYRCFFVATKDGENRGRSAFYSHPPTLLKYSAVEALLGEAPPPHQRVVAFNEMFQGYMAVPALLSKD